MPARPNLSRRSFLVGAAAAAALPAAARGPLPAPADAPQARRPATRGYRVTPHIRNFYRAAATL